MYCPFFVLQGENGVISYKFSTQETVPPYGADYFYINPSTGEILTINNLRGDNTNQYRVSCNFRRVTNCCQFCKVFKKCRYLI